MFCLKTHNTNLYHFQRHTALGPLETPFYFANCVTFFNNYCSKTSKCIELLNFLGHYCPRKLSNSIKVKVSNSKKKITTKRGGKQDFFFVLMLILMYHNQPGTNRAAKEILILEFHP